MDPVTKGLTKKLYLMYIIFHGHFPIIPLVKFHGKTFGSHNLTVLYSICFIMRCVIQGPLVSEY